MVNNGEESDSQMEAEQGLDAGDKAKDRPPDDEESLPSHTKLPARITTPTASAIRDMGVVVWQRLLNFEKEPKIATSKTVHLDRNQVNRAQEDCSLVKTKSKHP